MEDDTLTLLKEKGAILDGHFLLSSGLHSDKYIQCAILGQYPEISENLMKKIAEKYLTGMKVDVVLSPAIGAILFGYELARILSCRFIFCERKEGRWELRRNFTLHPRERAAIMEDVITTGSTVADMVKITRHHGADPIGIYSIVNRGEIDSIYDVEIHSLIRINIKNFMPAECEMCKQGIPLEKPGSREFFK